MLVRMKTEGNPNTAPVGMQTCLSCEEIIRKISQNTKHRAQAMAPQSDVLAVLAEDPSLSHSIRAEQLIPCEPPHQTQMWFYDTEQCFRCGQKCQEFTRNPCVSIHVPICYAIRQPLASGLCLLILCGMTCPNGELPQAGDTCKSLMA